MSNPTALSFDFNTMSVLFAQFMQQSQTLLQPGPVAAPPVKRPKIEMTGFVDSHSTPQPSAALPTLVKREVAELPAVKVAKSMSTPSPSEIALHPQFMTLWATFSEHQKNQFLEWRASEMRRTGANTPSPSATVSPAAVVAGSHAATSPAATVADFSSAADSTIARSPRQLRSSAGPSYVQQECDEDRDEEGKDFEFLIGKQKSNKCPRCSEHVHGKPDVVRREHYIQWHYDTYYSNSSNQFTVTERWIGKRLGRKLYPKRRNSRVCLHCEDGDLHKGRIGLLQHIQKVHPEEFVVLKSEYDWIFRNESVEDASIHELLIESIIQDIQATSGRRTSKRKRFE